MEPMIVATSFPIDERAHACLDRDMKFSNEEIVVLKLFNLTRNRYLDETAKDTIDLLNHESPIGKVAIHADYILLSEGDKDLIKELKKQLSVESKEYRNKVRVFKKIDLHLRSQDELGYSNHAWVRLEDA